MLDDLYGMLAKLEESCLSSAQHSGETVVVPSHALVGVKGTRYSHRGARKRGGAEATKSPPRPQASPGRSAGGVVTPSTSSGIVLPTTYQRASPLEKRVLLGQHKPATQGPKKHTAKGQELKEKR